MDARDHAKVWSEAADKLKGMVESANGDPRDMIAMSAVCLLARVVSTAYSNEACGR